MGSRARQAVGPIYLLACLVLGGSAQGIWANMTLQLLGIAIITWAAVAPVDEPLIPAARQFLCLAILALGFVAIQLVPLPSSLWPRLAGRGPIAAGYGVLGLGVAAAPLSLTPYKSLDSVLGLIPPLAIFCSIVRLKAYRMSWLAAALLGGTIAGVLLGALQVGSADFSSPWYLYEDTNYGVAVGFFANANHMAILLVIALPFIAALLGSAKSANQQRNAAMIAAGCAAGIVIIVGIALNRSLAGYGLAVPVVIASTLLVLPQQSRFRPWILALAALLVIGVIGTIATSATRTDQLGLGQDASTSVTSRQEMLVTTTRAIRDFLPWGSGLGSFRSVYHLYESREHITPTYVVHAHDDYVELLLEMGVVGALLTITFLLWWARAAWRAWRYADAGIYARAASIATAAILLHSLVDFPLRTAAISSAFAMCIALLVERRGPMAAENIDFRPTRHVVLR